MQLHPRVRGRVSALIAVLGKEMDVLDPNKDGWTAGEFAAAEPKTA